MILPFLDSFEKFLIFAFTLSLLVVVHEAGHFWVARWNGVAVTEFAVGFGPAIFSIRSKRSGTRYRINLFPIGGYCAMMGEDARRAIQDDPIGVSGVDYNIRGPWQRFGIIAAGPIVNLFAAFVILLAGVLFIGTPNDHSSTKIGKIVAGNPADRAGLRPGDQITSIDGKPISDGATMVKIINASLGKTLTLGFTRHGEQMSARVAPIPMEQHGKKIGVTGFMPLTEYTRLPLSRSFGEAWREMKQMLDSTFLGLSDLVMHANTAGDELVGPVGMARAAVAIQDYGVGAYLWFAAFISLSLGIFNLLPIPALDGGRILFILVELVRGRPMDPDKEAMVHMTGFAALIAFVLFRTYSDIINMVAGKSAI